MLSLWFHGRDVFIWVSSESSLLGEDGWAGNDSRAGKCRGLVAWGTSEWLWTGRVQMCGGTILRNNLAIPGQTINERTLLLRVQFNVHAKLHSQVWNGLVFDGGEEGHSWHLPVVEQVSGGWQLSTRSERQARSSVQIQADFRMLSLIHRASYHLHKS